MKPSLAALGIALIVFLIYQATLLPGLDFGDTGSFQTMAGSPVITPRDAYPLYFAVGDTLLALLGGDPAHVFNLASAIEAAIACGLIVIVSAELSGSLLAGASAGLLFAGSYTFWSQSIIAEVYALHAACVSLTLLLLLRWERTPTLSRLTLFFAAYAIGFGNHLSMILLLPAYALFVILVAPRGWRDWLSPRVVAIAAAFALIGALQYGWNLRGLWVSMTPPDDFASALGRFWFDITKADWRATTVLGIPRAVGTERLEMYQFDVLQQYGWSGVTVAVLGLVALAFASWKRAVLLLIMYGFNAVFALTYNVGDTHVFLLPSHLVVALMIGCGIGLLQRSAQSVAVHPGARHHVRGAPFSLTGSVVGGAFAMLAFWQIWDNYPALDRSNDHRPEETLARITRGLDDRRAILLEHMNWQVENGLDYFAKRLHPEVAFARMEEVGSHTAALAADNEAIGRDLVFTEGARSAVESDGWTPQPVRDSIVAVPGLAEAVGSVTAGTPYVMCVLRPSRDFPLDDRELGDAIEVLTAGRIRRLPPGDYQTIAGIAGEPPYLTKSSNGPFRAEFLLDRIHVEVRMESWLAFDTIRRMGFGQVIANRHHALIVERGVSFVALDEEGAPNQTIYVANIFAPQPRYILRTRDRTPADSISSRSQGAKAKS